MLCIRSTSATKVQCLRKGVTGRQWLIRRTVTCTPAGNSQNEQGCVLLLFHCYGSSVASGILSAHYRQKLGLQEVLWNLWILHHWCVCPWKVVFLGTPWWFGENSYCASLRLALSSIFFPRVHVFSLPFIRMLFIGLGLIQVFQNDLISRAIITSAKTILHMVQFIGSRQLATLWESHHSTCSTNCVL